MTPSIAVSGHVHVADAAASGLLDALAIVVDPVEIANAVFVCVWLYGDFPRAVGTGLPFNFRVTFFRPVLKVCVNILGRSGRLSVDGD